MIIRLRRKSKRSAEIELYEIFLDSSNLPQFNTAQMEGRLEKPIRPQALYFLGAVFLFIGIAFVFQLGKLQVKKGGSYAAMSESNSLQKQPIFAERGIIYDRNGVRIAWNTSPSSPSSTTSTTNTTNTTSTITDTTQDVPFDDESITSVAEFPTRSYMTPGLSHILGYVNYPAKDSSGNYWQTSFVGKDGVEKHYDTLLSGQNGMRIAETSARGKVAFQNVISRAVPGTNVSLTIDSRLQQQLFTDIKNLADSSPYLGGGGIIMDIHSGEVLAMTSYPEYDSNILSKRSDSKIVSSYFTNPARVFMNRVIDGVYTPGSIIKPFMAIAALNENIISPTKKILSTGSISIPNPYNPLSSTVFKDWKAHGWVDMRQAIAVSSDVYFYEIGGGYKDQKGLGIRKIDEYSKAFGIGEKTGATFTTEQTGTIPTPEWKADHFAGDPWRVGDTYHTVIGQYGYQVTPIQMVRAVAALANHGMLVTPQIVKNVSTADELGQEKVSELIGQEIKKPVGIDIPDSYYTIVDEGMRQMVTEGTGSALNIAGVKVAAKSGTAQVGLHNTKVNAWLVGFFPYDNPKYAFTILMEKGPTSGVAGATAVMRPFFQWLVQNAPEYVQ